MPKFQPRINVPEIVSLQFPKGKEVQSEFNGTEFLYTLEDGRSWYANPAVSRMIEDLSLGKGEPFEVTKIENPRGKGFLYQVKHLMTTPAAPAGGRPQTQTTVRPSVTSTQPNGFAVQDGCQPVHQNSSASSSMIQRMMASFSVAVDAIAEAAAYAQRRGLTITFSSEDVRATALTVFINNCKEGR